MTIDVISYHECAITIVDVANHDVDPCFTQSDTITTDDARNNTTIICIIDTDKTTPRDDKTRNKNAANKNAAVSSLDDDDVAGTVAFQ